MLSNFQHLTPEVIFDAVERLGGRCTGRYIPLNAMENRVYQVEREEQEPVVVKFYRPGRWDKATIQSEHDFLHKLEENEVPVVCPLKGPGGETILEQERILFTVFPKKPGRLEPELGDEQLTRLGRFLARIHQVGAGMPKVPRPELTPTTFGRQSLEYLASSEKMIPGFLPRYQEMIDRICSAIEPYYDNYPRILLHGDCHCGNVLWRNDQPYFIDFDDMLYAPVVQDMWMLTGGDDSYGKDKRKVLLEAYEELQPFDPAQLKLIEPLRALRMIYFSAWIARRWEDGAFQMAFPQFGTERYWTEQIEGLSVQLEKISQD